MTTFTKKTPYGNIQANIWNRTVRLDYSAVRKNTTPEECHEQAKALFAAILSELDFLKYEIKDKDPKATHTDDMFKYPYSLSTKVQFIGEGPDNDEKFRERMRLATKRATKHHDQIYGQGQAEEQAKQWAEIETEKRNKAEQTARTILSPYRKILGDAAYAKLVDELGEKMSAIPAPDKGREK